ncbi:LPXTG cell wall anchor domain-containing protein [Macrococcus carouselicus]|uniref:LPXTG cell wall anchor domain-containing protein n=1 Tax=Macrococcus carouselicus TaxID=69969 RepID=A0A9Q8CM82_9STAP|nr:LPXTG cell wall anchor domain-containing protein [Macrococcus carouselicus]TDM02483.1 LPXTG cell wall anchor domain-containing protein [Macrococcus carouselicus]
MKIISGSLMSKTALTAAILLTASYPSVYASQNQNTSGTEYQQPSEKIVLSSDNPTDFDPSWLTPVRLDKVNQLTQMKDSGQLSQDDYNAQVSAIMNEQIEDHNNDGKTPDGMINLNDTLPHGFDTSWLTQDRQQRVNELAQQKDNGSLTQYDFNKMVSDIMNEQLSEQHSNMTEVPTTENPLKVEQIQTDSPILTTDTPVQVVTTEEPVQKTIEQPTTEVMQLPDTGEEQSNYPAIFVGLTLIAGALLMLFTRKRVQK